MKYILYLFSGEVENLMNEEVVRGATRTSVNESMTNESPQVVMYPKGYTNRTHSSALNINIATCTSLRNQINQLTKHSLGYF